MAGEPARDDATELVDEATLLAGQLAYYRARAGEYDRWYRREGRYDRGPAATSAWLAELAEVEAGLAAVPVDGLRALELAPGTGIWTERLAERAASVTGLDASPEMLERCRGRLGDLARRVELRCVDLFDWEPEERWDLLFAGFWLSHVPERRLASFVAKMARAPVPGGRILLVDSRPEPTSTAVDHRLPPAGEERMTRRLDDGREFEIVKRFRTGPELERAFGVAGITLEAHETATYFVWATGRLDGPGNPSARDLRVAG